MAGKNQVVLTFAGESKNLEKTIDRVGASTKKGFGSMATVATAAFATVGVAVAGFGALAIKSASDLAETQSKVKVLFGDSAKAIEEFATTAAGRLGQSKQSALDAASTFAVFGKGAGLAGDKLVDFSKDMTVLASDLASFNNTSPEQAIEAIGAALRGESEPIRQYGVLLDDATLRSEALRMGLVKTTKEALTPQQKVLAAQAAILKQTTAAQGDFERTSGGLANQQRIMKAQLANVTAELGTKLIPVAMKFSQWGLAAIGWMKEHEATVKPLAIGLGVLAAVIGTIVVVTKIWTAVQTAFNVVMALNPVGLVILAVVALVAIIVLIATKTTWFQTIWRVAWGGIKAAALAVWDWLKGLPGMLGKAFGKLADIITAPFRMAFNAIAKLWNSTIGKLSFSVPDWIPGLGGKGFSMPKLPTFHSGGVVPGSPGTEVLALLQAGERVTPAGGSGGATTVHLIIEGTGLLKGLRREIRTQGGNVQLVLGS